jgi:hypothetical protein
MQAPHHLGQPGVCILEHPALDGLVQGSHVAVLHHQLDLQQGSTAGNSTSSDKGGEMPSRVAIPNAAERVYIKQPAAPPTCSGSTCMQVPSAGACSKYACLDGHSAFKTVASGGSAAKDAAHRIAAAAAIIPGASLLLPLLLLLLLLLCCCCIWLLAD